MVIIPFPKVERLKCLWLERPMSLTWRPWMQRNVRAVLKWFFGRSQCQCWSQSICISADTGAWSRRRREWFPWSAQWHCLMSLHWWKCESDRPRPLKVVIQRGDRSPAGARWSTADNWANNIQVQSGDIVFVTRWRCMSRKGQKSVAIPYHSGLPWPRRWPYLALSEPPISERSIFYEIALKIPVNLRRIIRKNPRYATRARITLSLKSPFGRLA